MKTTTHLLAITVAACLWAGCTHRKIEYGGVSYTSTRLLNQETIGGLTVTSTNGVVFKMDAYTSDQVQAVGAIAEGVAKGLAASVKP